ncbi:MAG TPA: hypothetical protein PKE21_11405 [Flavobacteriales bacterium]|nr:hypothetical protein [Flavobacteriales bacterium]HMR28077.1 hypothetical protein [Flavobacteriales bacterium]
MHAYALAVIAGALAFLAGCTKEGEQGPPGPAGPGGSLNVEVSYHPFPAQGQWSGSGTTSYRTTLSVPSLTQDVLLNGFVRVHHYEVTVDDTLFNELPFSVTDPQPVVTYDHTDTIGAVTIATNIPGGFHQNPGVVFANGAYGFRVATIR